MKISYNWLQNYFEEKLPSPLDVAQGIIFHSFEVEEVEKVGDDTVFDIKILPDRAHDCLSHWGIAKEVSMIFNLPIKDIKYEVPKSHPTKLIKRIETPLCRRYMGRVIRNIKIGPSPEWVVKHLETIGQRSINNIVDATNIVTFDCGQPAHVFDLSRVKDLRLQVRNAKNGEKITLLGGAEKTLDDTMLVIADDYGNALDIAGIKGGAYAELSKDTTDIILECANFDPTSVRKTAQVLNILTDAKKRFENDLSPELAEYGMKELSARVCEMCPDAIFEEIVDVYPKKVEQTIISISIDYINKRLGSNFTKEEIESVWGKLNFKYTEKDSIFEIEIPYLRIDLIGPHDLTEEVIRVLGYDKLQEKLPEIKIETKVNDKFSKMLFARRKLLNDGYSEIMTYVFRDSGEVEVLASASDKKFLRNNLKDGLLESLKLNQLNAPFLEMKEIKIFEIGTVFFKDGEEMHVAYNEKKNIVEMTLDKFFSENPSLEEHGYFSAEKFLVLAPSRSQGSSQEDSHKKIFVPWSIYPFISRDVAVWMPEGESAEKLKNILKENGTDLLIKEPYLFDSFIKDGKTSYAFRLVFQSYDRTLTDTEINDIMTNINHKISENTNWQIR